MKKLLTALIALALVFAMAVPALAHKDAPIFNASFHLVDNEPTVEYDEWDIPYNVWNAIPDDTAIHAGDTVTMVLNYTVPETVDGYDERLAASIEFITSIEGVSDLTLVEAQGCPGKLECDYDIGICYPIAGEYANVELNGNELKVMAELNSSVAVVVRGTADADRITGSTDVTIGQYRFPAQFSLCTVDKANANGYPSYNAHWSDFALVQKRAVEFRTEDGENYTMFAAKNNHYYRYVPEGKSIGEFIPVDENFADNGEPLSHEDEMYQNLSDILTNVIEFFSLSFEQTAFADSDFIGEGEHYTFSYPFEFGSDEPAPTDAPVTEEPAPTEDPGTPPTGAISLSFIGAAVIAGGAAVLVRRKND